MSDSKFVSCCYLIHQNEFNPQGTAAPVHTKLGNLSTGESLVLQLANQVINICYCLARFSHWWVLNSNNLERDQN